MKDVSPAVKQINDETKRARFLETESQRIVKLPNYVWDDIRKRVKSKYNLTIPRKSFSFSYFLYKSGKFIYADFANKISLVKARVMFSLLARRLGIGIIKDTDGSYGFVALAHLDGEAMEALFESYKASSRYEIVAGDEEE